MVSEKAEKEKKFRLKAGRYIRVEAQSRIARVDEEYDLLRKFSNYHFSSISNTPATIYDLNMDHMKEYVSKTSDRNIMLKMSKEELGEALNLIDKNDPTGHRVRNFAVLMFSDSPENYIPYSYTELIIDMYGTKRKMESKTFKGPIWKQYLSITSFIRDYYLNDIVIRENGAAVNRRVSNFPFAAVEELVANAIVHNNYENAKVIQIYISELQINIVNYNKPLPPLQIKDLNERYIFNERDTENPEIRDMFKALGIIESFGTGIGEAKKALEQNGSPQLFYKVFGNDDNITSVVIPVNEEYIRIKNNTNTKEHLGIDAQFQDTKQKILKSKFSTGTKENMVKIYEGVGDDIFGNSKVVDILKCADNTATAYLRKMCDELKIIKPVDGHGKGKYKFV